MNYLHNYHKVIKTGNYQRARMMVIRKIRVVLANRLYRMEGSLGESMS